MAFNQRLSTSGPFIGNPPLQIGPGSCGLVWRAQGAGTPAALTALLTDIPWLTGTPDGVDGGDELIVSLRPGYLYDVEMSFLISPTTGVADQNVTCLVEVGSGNPGLPNQLADLSKNITGPNANTQQGTNRIAFGNVAYAPTVEVTRVRARVSGSTGLSLSSAMLRICEYTTAGA